MRDALKQVTSQATCKVEVVSATQHLLASLHGWQRKYYDEHDKVVFWRLVAWGMTCVCFIIAIIK